MLDIRTQRLQLVPLTLPVAEVLQENPKEMGRRLGLRVAADWPGQDMLDYLPLYMRSLRNHPDILGWGIWLIIHPTLRMIIGDVGFVGWPDGEGCVEMGYGVAPSQRRQGYATEAARALTEWALAHSEVHRVEAKVRADNEPSRRVLQHVGMHRVSAADDLETWLIDQEDRGEQLSENPAS